MYLKAVFILLVMGLLPMQAHASPGEKAWLDLVFSVDGQPQVRDASFYLADTSLKNWEALEYQLTLDQKDLPFVGQESHPRCKYPARYFWLGIKHTGSPWLPPAFCSELNSWVDLQQLTSVDLLFVSGYLSNPASTFGHTLLNIRTRGTDGFRMLETSVNFGAIIPQGEALLPYLVKGLFGGYLARFSDGEYAANDQTYQVKEMRPIWRLALDLSEQQATFLVLLIAERTDVKLDYFFLSENCAWSMARMMELALGISLEASEKPTWFAPIELVYSLYNTLNPATGRPLVGDTRYEASQQQLLQARIEKLLPSEQVDYSLLVSKPPRFQREDGSAIESIGALDAALTYWEIKNLATETGALAVQKDAVLKARLALPPKPKTAVKVGPKASENIEKAQSVSQYGLGLQHTSIGQTEYTFRMAPFEQGNQTLHPLGIGKELSVLNGQARFNSDGASLEFLELIRVSSVSQPDKTGLSPLGGQLAWGFHMGSKVLETDPEFRMRREKGGIAGQDLYADLKLGMSKAGEAGDWLLAAYTGTQFSTGEHPVVPRLELNAQYRQGMQWVAGAAIEYKNAYESHGLSGREPRVFIKNHVSWVAGRDKRLVLGLWHSDLDTGLNFSINNRY